MTDKSFANILASGIYIRLSIQYKNPIHKMTGINGVINMFAGRVQRENSLKILTEKGNEKSWALKLTQIVDIINLRIFGSTF